jgi:hypothetical protein
MSRKGSPNKPRDRMMRLIEEQWPDFDPVARMIEAAEIARADILKRIEAYQALPADADIEELQRARVQTGELNALSAMYERPARYLAPQLKAMEVKAGGLNGGPITVVFQAAEE